jgi:predicted PurR-regulated permease PerM
MAEAPGEVDRSRAPYVGPERRKATREYDRIRFTNRTVVVAVLILVGALTLVGVVTAARRVIGWVVVAAFIAALLHPIVARLSRYMMRGIAILIVVLVTLATISGIVYLSVDDLQTQAKRIERIAPQAAVKLEHSKRFGEAARAFELRRRTQEFVKQLPTQLQGGDSVSAIKTAATRGVAYFATGMLTLFLLIHGRRLAVGGLSQVYDPERRRRTEALLTNAYAQAWKYVMFTFGRAILAGAFTAMVCNFAHVRAAFLLALWVALWSLIPLMGVAVGSIAVVLLTIPVDGKRALAVLALFIAYQVFEIIVIQRRLERASLHLGPAITLLAAIGGLELYGIGGLLVGVGSSVVVISILRELARSGAGGVLEAADELLPGDEPVA